MSGPVSLWPAYPSVATTNVVLGVLPGGREITGTVSRTRYPDANNLPDPATVTAVQWKAALDRNPARMEVWRLQSVVRYTVGSRSYLKARTVVRSQ